MAVHSGPLLSPPTPLCWAGRPTGSKRLVDEYFAAVERLLAVVQQSPSVPGREKYSFFKQLSQQHGRTAVMLSGGAALGVYHVGVPTPPPPDVWSGLPFHRLLPTPKSSNHGDRDAHKRPAGGHLALDVIPGFTACTGVVKALWQAGLMPKVIAGSSAGSIVAALLCRPLFCF